MNVYGPTLKVTLSDDQMDRLKALARECRLSTSQLVRQLIDTATLEGSDHGKAIIR